MHAQKFFYHQKKSHFYHLVKLVGGTNEYRTIHTKITREMYDDSACDPTLRTFVADRRVFH